MPIVLSADINITESGEAYKKMTENHVNTRHVAGDVKEFATFHDCSPETHSTYYIDYILCAENIRAVSYHTVTAGIDGRFVSNHFPVYSDMMIR